MLVVKELVAQIEYQTKIAVSSVLLLACSPRESQSISSQTTIFKVSVELAAKQVEQYVLEV